MFGKGCMLCGMFFDEHITHSITAQKPHSDIHMRMYAHTHINSIICQIHVDYSGKSALAGHSINLRHHIQFQNTKTRIFSANQDHQGSKLD
jgi:hypothetical protein